MTVIGAMALDAYRELNAKKMFWITMILSVLVTCVLFVVGLSPDNELMILHWNLGAQLPAQIDLSQLLRMTFVALGVSFWLAWAATILALISTASIIPDFISSGTIDVMLAKPVRRVSLYLTKYSFGLLFVALQVTAFSLGAFLIIGGRTGDWEFGVFLAVPLVTLFFSYLFVICSFIGLLTRSTLAAILVTVLFWVVIFALNTADGTIAQIRIPQEIYVEKLENQVEVYTRRSQDPESTESERNLAAQRLAEAEEKLPDQRDKYADIRFWHDIIVGVKTALPKTQETIGLLERELTEVVRLPEDPDEDPAQQPFISNDMFRAGVRATDVMTRLQEMYRSRSLTWVIGTSLLFEALILALSCWIFARRDF